jgi:predicted PurR-regulated permease PerM
MNRGLDRPEADLLEGAEGADPEDDAAPRLRRMLITSLTLLCAGLVLAGLYFGADILVPLTLAALLGFVLDPLVNFLTRWRWPRALAVTVVMLFTAGVLACTAVFVGSQIAALSHDLPTYQSTIQKKLRTLRQTIVARRPFGDASSVLDVVEGEVDAARRALAPSKPAAATRVQVEPAAKSPLQSLMDLVGPVLKPVGTAGLVLVFLIFILLGRSDLRDRALRLVGGNLHQTTDAMNEAAQRVSRYLTMQLLINLLYGLPFAVGLWLIGVPGAPLWGLLSITLRFLPYVGSIIGAVFPLTLAFAVDPGWDMFLWTAGLVLTLELISNNVAEPLLYGSSTGLGPLAVLVSATFWTVLWGPVGLVLATPLTVCLVVMGRHLPPLRFLDVLLGSDPVFDAPTRLYQRLLAGNVEEAIEQAECEVQHESLRRFYSATAVPALALALREQARCAPEHRRRVQRGLSALVRDLRAAVPPVPAIGEPLLCIGLRTDADNLAAQMLAHALAVEGLPAQALPATRVSAEQIPGLALGSTPGVVLVSAHPPPGVVARYVCRRLRREWPGVPLVISTWHAPAGDEAPPAAGRGADAAAELGADRLLDGFEATLDGLLAPETPPEAPAQASPSSAASAASAPPVRSPSRPGSQAVESSAGSARGAGPSSPGWDVARDEAPSYSPR